MLIAVIPARAGSKGLVGKNLLTICDLPLIVWTVKAALESDCFEDVIVSTDCPEIAAVASINGARIPFLRDPLLASDTAKTSDLIFDLVERSEILEKSSICLLQPTSPLRNASHIKESKVFFEREENLSVVSVCEFKLGGEWLFKVNEKYNDHDFKGLDNRPSRRQDADTYVYPNGAIYWTSITNLRRYSSFVPPNFLPYIMEFWDSVDIDSQRDFDVASFLLEQRTKGGNK